LILGWYILWNKYATTSESRFEHPLKKNILNKKHTKEWLNKKIQKIHLILGLNDILAKI